MKKPLSRRTLLRGAGGIAIALPFLDAMSAFAQTAPVKRRLVTLFTANGTVRRKWLPTGTETNFTLSEILQPLAAHKSDLLVLDGIDNKQANNSPGDGAHQRGMASLWTGMPMVEVGGTWTGGGISVDQHVANKIALDANGKLLTQYKSLQLRTGSVTGTLGLQRMVFAGSGQSLTPELDPFKLFSSVFSSVGGGDAAQIAIAQKKSILDAAMDDYHSLSPKLGPTDRLKLEEHLSAIRDIEQRLSITSTGSSACVKPTVGTTIDPKVNANYPKICDLMVDMLAMALICDLTRVASLQFSQSVSLVTFNWLGQSKNHHAHSHDPLPESLPADATAAQRAAAEAVEAEIVAIDRWYAGKVANLIAKLKAAPEGNGSVFDNTLIVWGNELGRGNNHSRKLVPFVLAGSAGGRLRTGRFVKYSSKPHNDLLVSVMNAMGVAGTSFGNPTYCTGPLANLT